MPPPRISERNFWNESSDSLQCQLTDKYLRHHLAQITAIPIVKGPVLTIRDFATQVPKALSTQNFYAHGFTNHFEENTFEELHYEVYGLRALIPFNCHAPAWPDALTTAA
ncbi:unnamed protein product [Cuscuta epithymum]|uniref:Uncharacterized protein n=1 Tax=Cuscuta epithymum TaxID=186058 RepID=A0AAV0FVJ8_9ASTE|nr:unnamed protein product [Cuscuta epithymum]